MQKRRFLIILAALAAVIYNSWPLGYIVDPSVLEHNYVSVLEVSGRPYWWLFITLDCVAATISLIIGILIWRINQPARKSLIGFLVFGLATYFEALSPIRCTGSIKACGTSLSQVLTVHDIASILSAFGLLASLWFGVHFVSHHGFSPNIKKLALISFWLWSLSGIFLIVSVGLNRFSSISQIIFIAMCGLALITIPVIFSLPTKQKAKVIDSTKNA